MSTRRYSPRWKSIDPGSYSPEIQHAVETLRTHAADGNVELRYWNESYVAAALPIAVDLPSRGTVNGIDIRPQEPILIVFHTSHYPFRAPMARSDRKDFPREELPHLNPVGPKHPPYLCLHRGSIDAWFNQHTLDDFVQRVRSWFRDAGRNRLIRADDRFEPTRFDTAPGFAIFDPHEFANLIAAADTSLPQSRLLVFRVLREQDPTSPDTFAINYWIPARPESMDDLNAIVAASNRLASENAAIERHLFGLLLWPPPGLTFARYIATLPSNFGELRQLGEEFGIDIAERLREFRQADLFHLPLVPITLAIRRPMPIIGHDTDFDFVTFVVLAGQKERDSDAVGEVKSSARVYPLANRKPLTPARAQRLSRVRPLNRPVLTIGTGAVGSKLGFHLGRSGESNLQFVDNDNLSPHNLVRHGLTARWLGKNKAEGVRTEISEMFRNHRSLAVRADDRSAFQVLLEPIERRTLVVDCSASPAVFNAIVHSEQTCRFVRCELAHEGQLGLLLAEGPSRNPRLDDVRAMLFDLAIGIEPLSSWLQAHQQRIAEDPTFEEIDIGLGCSSDTLPLADDLVSFHSAAFARALHDFHDATVGLLQINSWNLSRGSALADVLAVEAFAFSHAANDPAWTIRISSPAKISMSDERKKAKKVETGGLLFGRIDVLKRTLHVTRAVPPPPDSQGSQYAFHRGIEDVPELVERITRLTGGQINYVGEWHTHPRGRPIPSPTDLQAVNEIRSNLDRVGRPTHIIIVAPKGLASWIYGPHTANPSPIRRRRLQAKSVKSTRR